MIVYANCAPCNYHVPIGYHSSGIEGNEGKSASTAEAWR